LKIYYYCSYDGSPAGFHIGTIDCEKQPENIYQDLTEINSSIPADNFIRLCFETGLVRRAFGAIPSNEDNIHNYFILLKKLTGKKDGCNYYMNIAITTTDWEEFEALTRTGSSNNGQNNLPDAVLGTISTDKTNSFGYCINTSRLEDIQKIHSGSILGCKSPYIKLVKNENTFFILSSSTPSSEDKNSINTITENLETALRLHGLAKEKKLAYIDKNVFQFKKKTTSKKIYLVVLLTLFIMVLVLAMINLVL